MDDKMVIKINEFKVLLILNFWQYGIKKMRQNIG